MEATQLRIWPQGTDLQHAAPPHPHPCARIIPPSPGMLTYAHGASHDAPNGLLVQS